MEWDHWICVWKQAFSTTAWSCNIWILEIVQEQSSRPSGQPHQKPSGHTLQETVTQYDQKTPASRIRLMMMMMMTYWLIDWLIDRFNDWWLIDRQGEQLRVFLQLQVLHPVPHLCTRLLHLRISDVAAVLHQFLDGERASLARFLLISVISVASLTYAVTICFYACKVFNQHSFKVLSETFRAVGLTLTVFGTVFWLNKTESCGSSSSVRWASGRASGL